MDARLDLRRDVLASFGAGGGVAEELLGYTENHFQPSMLDASQFPLADEPFVASWEEYAREASAQGSILPLSKYLVQLQFPIQTGMSGSPEYRAATGSGEPARGRETQGLKWHAPRRSRIVIHSTPAGRIPLLIAEEREDFVVLVQALTRRNEPDPVPDSMGACMVSGYNNWHRISILREQFAALPSATRSWSEEFQRIKQQRELYQDRFIILSSGPYSAVQASALGLDDEEWRKLSLVIRREHECTHYFTRRVFGSMRNNLLDEMIADYMGITAALGRFRADWFLRFYGLEAFPVYRAGGRLENYRGDPRLSDPAFAALQRMVAAAAQNLEQFDRHHVPEFRHAGLLPILLMMFTGLTMEELASKQAATILAEAFARLSRSGHAEIASLKI